MRDVQLPRPLRASLTVPSMAEPPVSILLPTLNAERDLARLLPALEQQDLPEGSEFLAIDSSSSDGTVALLQEAGFQVEVIPREEFRHGATRNRLASRARGKVLVFLTQDALPSEPGTLAALLAALADPSTAAVAARLVPHDSDDPLTARTVLASPEASGLPDLRLLTHGARVDQLAPRDAVRVARFHNVASAYRADVLRGLPFPETPFGEDVAWARAALDAGHGIGHAPGAVVRHAHRYTMASAFERYRLDAVFLRREFGVLTRPALLDLLRGWLHELREDVRFVPSARHGRLLALLRAPFLRAAQVLGQFAGTRGWNPGGGSSATRRYN